MSRHARRRPFRPAVEALEGRALLSVCTVDRLTDLDEGKGNRGSLRYCVIESLFRADVINFEVTGVISLTRALAALTRSVRIEGPGAGLITVRRDTGGDYRIFTVAAGVTAGLSGLTIANGRITTDPGGGGILNSGMLSVSNSIVTGNTTTREGGGIYNGGTLTLDNSTVSGNSLSGIFNSGTMTVSNSLVANNTSGIFGAGGIKNAGTMTISGSTVSGNTAGNGAAGIYNGGMMTVLNSAVTGNTVNGGTLGGDGGGIQNYVTLTVSGSTISGNSARDFGGGISNRERATISNSTISGNSVRSGHGGGIYNDGSQLTIRSSTIAGNSATTQGGGIDARTPMAVRSTLIAGNMANLGPDVSGNLGSQGHNLLGSPEGASGWVATDLLHVNPRLGPLADNGGPTSTHALLPGSPAVNAGDPAAGTSLAFPKWDQRGPGFARIAGGRLDIGAFEVQGRAGIGGKGEADVAGVLSWLAGVRKGLSPQAEVADSSAFARRP